HPHRIRDGFLTYTGIQCVFAQPRAAAVRAARIPAVLAQEDAHMQFVLLRVEVIEELPDSVYLLVAFDHKLLLSFGQIAEWRLVTHTRARLLAKRGEPSLAFGPRPRLDRAFIQ